MRHPICIGCEKPMVPTFAFPHKEWACLPCNQTDEFFASGHPTKDELTYGERGGVTRRKNLWGDELHRIGMELNGNAARCTTKHDTGSCHICDVPEFQFKYWKSKVKG